MYIIYHIPAGFHLAYNCAGPSHLYWMGTMCAHTSTIKARPMCTQAYICTQLYVATSRSTWRHMRDISWHSFTVKSCDADGKKGSCVVARRCGHIWTRYTSGRYTVDLTCNLEGECVCTKLKEPNSPWKAVDTCRLSEWVWRSKHWSPHHLYLLAACSPARQKKIHTYVSKLALL